MAKPFKFRHVNEIAGVFVLAVVALLVVGVVLMATSQGWFTATQRVTLQLPPEGSQGLRPGADVQILGNVVGTVREIHPDPDPANPDRLLAEVAIKADFMDRFVRTDSHYVIRKTLGFGDAYVEIFKTRGAGAPVTRTDRLAVPPGEADSTAPTVEGAIADLRKAIVPAVEKAGAAFEEHRKFAAELRESNQSLHRAIGRIDAVVAKTERGEGLAGKVLADAALADEASRAVPKVHASLDEAQAVLKEVHRTAAALSGQSKATLERMQAILADIQKTTAALPETARSVSRTAEAMPGLVVQMQETMRQVQRLVEGLQRSFLVRGAIAPDDTGARIRPESIGSGGK